MMIDAEKLLGGLLRGSLDSSLGGLGSVGGAGLPGKAAVGMGILGIAIAAFEHFAEQKSATPREASFPDPRVAAGRPAPPSPPDACAPSMAVPPPPPPPAAVPLPVIDADPVLLLRAMIAAAHADGSLDDAERKRILDFLGRAALSEEERAFMARELDAPGSMADIVASVRSVPEAEQVFAVSLLAVEVDTEAERAHLEQLRQLLGIASARASEIARSMGR